MVPVTLTDPGKMEVMVKALTLVESRGTSRAARNA